MKTTTNHYDVIVIGGGCNGTGLARDLALRGIKVALCEKGDFGAGATGASSGMIHGGPRYLLDDTETTKHACKDSGYIQKICPHLIFRVPFLLPILKKNPFGPLSLMLHDVFFNLYDRYTPLKNGLPHARLSVAEMLAIEPGIAGDADTFLGAVTLDEWGIDPVRLCLANAQDAENNGASIYTYTEVTTLLTEDKQRNKVSGVSVYSSQTGNHKLHAPLVFNCAGPWAGKLAESMGVTASIRPGKGVHLIYDKRLTNFAVITHAIDGREVFSIPYQNETWVGTTDDDYFGDLDNITAHSDDIDYLKSAMEKIIPAFSRQRLIGTRVGARNTIHEWGVTEDAMSRGYKVLDHTAEGRPGLYSLVGGKLASFRVQAEEAADIAATVLGNTTPCTTHKTLLPGGGIAPNDHMLALEFGVSQLAARRILSRHGDDAAAVLNIGKEKDTGFSVVCHCEPLLECEIRYCIRHDKVVYLRDLMTRCKLAMGPCQGTDCALRAAQIFTEERNLSLEQERQELRDLLLARWQTAAPILRTSNPLQLQQAELLLMHYGELLTTHPAILQASQQLMSLQPGRL